MAKKKCYMCPLLERELQDFECYDIRLVCYGYDNVDTLDFAFDKDEAGQICETCLYNKLFDGFWSLKPEIIIVFIILSLPIIIPILYLTVEIMRIISSNSGYWHMISERILNLLTYFRFMFLFLGTYSIIYIYSLRKTIVNKSISKISFLPLLHIILYFIFSYLLALLNNNFMTLP